MTSLDLNRVSAGIDILKKAMKNRRKQQIKKKEEERRGWEVRVTVTADVFDNSVSTPPKLRQNRKRKSQLCKYNTFYVITSQ